MSARVLHVLSQRPGRTGSGVTLDAVVRQAEKAGWEQAAVVGVPVTEMRPRVGEIPDSRIFSVTFGDEAAPGLKPDLGFPLPGMSDVMPYPSSVWSRMSTSQINQYRKIWTSHLGRVIADFQPHLIHSNHIWLVSSLLSELAPDIPRVATCHATGLRQMELCPRLAPEVISGCRQLDRIFALRQDHKQQLARLLEMEPERIQVTGVGFRDEIFFPREKVVPDPRSVLYVGKYSRAKGLPWLLASWPRLVKSHPGATLHLAGDGAGPEAEDLRRQALSLEDSVVPHGQVNQEQLAELMAKIQVCVLPSFYEGVPLVLAEAAACGCRIVATDLPGIREQLAPRLKSRLHTVAMPPLLGVDTPDPQHLPRFEEDLLAALRQGLDTAEKTPQMDKSLDLKELTWSGVFAKVESGWKCLI